MDCSPPCFSVHGILQARILERVVISFSRGSSRPRDRTQVSLIRGRHFNLLATREEPYSITLDKMSSPSHKILKPAIFQFKIIIHLILSCSLLIQFCTTGCVLWGAIFINHGSSNPTCNSSMSENSEEPKKKGNVSRFYLFQSCGVRVREGFV